MDSLNKKNFDIVSTYSGDKCLPFLKTTDKLNGLDLDLGNMSGHFPFKLGLSGKHIDIPTSEHLYVCGFFSDGSEMQTSIQRQIL